jgi:hypothetical protein
VAHREHADAQAAVETTDAFGAEEARRAGPHGRVGACGGAVGGEHARFENPDGIGDDLGCGAGGEGSDEEVGGGEAIGRPIVGGRGGARVREDEGALGDGFEEEEGGPAGGVAEEVGGEAAVEGGEGTVGLREGADY